MTHLRDIIDTIWGNFATRVLFIGLAVGWVPFALLMSAYERLRN